ncbi:probable ATP-dependent RNA helicase DHX37 [Strongylocentrotus purpuratus]|uniref:RNA helicase n=1 Tax=Strongylocentrotus purpuratus TaxID=7668 RepID=A0A7M7PA93_STRPU|nr:probable ATP-dependent RNA helicase DHX37 [Strongylocentrotus purpuratus]
MGKRKRFFNARARQVVDDSEVRKAHQTPCVAVDIAAEGHQLSAPELRGTSHGSELDSNALMLPGKKANIETKKWKGEQSQPRQLSKKQRKKLQKVLEQKEKKGKRAGILASLAEHQASTEEMARFTSFAHIGQKINKRKLDNTGPVKINSISGSNKKRKMGKQDDGSDGDEDDASSSSEEEEEEVEEEEGDKGEEMQEQGSDLDDGESSLHEDKNSASVYRTIDKEQHSASASDDNKARTKSESDNVVKDNVKSEPAMYVQVKRSPEIQEARLRLPILAEEQMVMEGIHDNPVVIICGETGSGKTTQVPQFLYEAGYAMKGLIGVTEPRRVAAVSMSQRVAKEMNLPTSVVSYQIRYAGSVSDETKIKFMTDGVLMKEVQKDFLLTKYSVIIIDEAHERSVYTDILIGLLSRIVPLRHKKGNPLRLVIMSATLRVEDFTENKRLFKVTPPVIKVESRQFPVTIHFNKRTPVEDYITEVHRKVLKIHRTLPPGGILVFVTGQHEVNTLCRKFKAVGKRAGPKREPDTSGTGPNKDQDPDEDQEPVHEDLKKAEEEKKAFKKWKLPKISLDSYSAQPRDVENDVDDEVDGDVDSDDQSEEELEDEVKDEEEKVLDSEAAEDQVPMHVLPMYSLLAPHRQAQVFQPPPEGSRMVVVATNVAETSLTIPGIKYVVDTGRVKRRFYDKVTGVSSFKVDWTSKASGNQRAGRAGRTEPGHCYRLFSSAVFGNDFETFDPPEITRRPVEDLILQMKDMGIDKVVNFPFPTCPDEESLKAAERLLIALGALEQPPKPKRFRDMKKEFFSTRITDVGRAMACLPVAPCYAKMISLGQQEGCLPYVIALVSALTVREIFEESSMQGHTDAEREAHKKLQARVAHNKKIWAGKGDNALLGDLMVLLGAVGASEYVGCTPGFCASHGLRYKAMVEIRKLRRLLTNAVNSVDSDCGVFMDPKMSPPTSTQVKMLRQIVLAGLGHHVAKRMSADQEGFERGGYQSVGIEGAVFIHPNSALFKQLPDYVVYQEIIETTKPYMRGVTAVEREWLPVLFPNLCTFSKPLEEPSPSYHSSSGTVKCHMTCTFGRNAWPLPAQELDYPKSLDKVKWFGRFLLEGKVIPGLKKFTPSLLSTPSTMIKTWAKLQPRTEVILKALAGKGVYNKSSLIEVWRKDRQYLLLAYQEWLPKDLHADLMMSWPPIKLDE